MSNERWHVHTYDHKGATLKCIRDDKGRDVALAQHADLIAAAPAMLAALKAIREYFDAYGTLDTDEGMRCLVSAFAAIDSAEGR